MSAVAAILFARQPVAGVVKTRLAAAIGREDAARLYDACLRDCAAALAATGHELRLAVTPESDAGWFRDAFPGVRIALQRGDDLGTRMRDALEQAWAEGLAGAVVFGSDSPTVPLAARRDALAGLPAAAIVLGADAGGGYYALGARRGTPLSWMERIPWGTATVLAATRRELLTARLTVAEVQPWYDIDVAADLERLRADLAAGHGYPAEHTRRALLGS